jgi:hypothetical protein
MLGKTDDQIKQMGKIFFEICKVYVLPYWSVFLWIHCYIDYVLNIIYTKFHQLLKYDLIFQIELLLLFSKKRNNGNEKY